MLGLSGQLLDSLTVKAPEPVAAPVIQPASAPAYVQPVSVAMLPAPNIAPPPPGQFRGEGGTAFGSAPRLYAQPIVPDGLNGGRDMYAPQSDDAGYNLNTPAPLLPETKPRPGDSTIQPVPRGVVPGKPAIAPAVEPVKVPATPGPIKGNVLGFDLSLVPLWAWIVGAALVGARVLK